MTFIYNMGREKSSTSSLVRINFESTIERSIKLLRGNSVWILNGKGPMIYFEHERKI